MAAAVAAVGSMFTAVVAFAVVIAICPCIDKLTAQIIVATSNGAFKTDKLKKADGSDAAEVEEYGICVAKGNKELLDVINKVLEKLIADGKVNEWTEEFNAKAAPES